MSYKCEDQLISKAIKAKTEVEVDYQIYVDGSYLNAKIGYGVVILKNGQVVAELSGAVRDPDAQNSRQIGGELEATKEGIKWCQKQGIKKVAIFYDLENIKKWATGEYKTNKPLTAKFKEFIASCEVKIDWHKVKAHTGVKWNERADKLAKEGTTKGGEAQKSNLVVELEEKAEKFTDYLQLRGYSVDFKGIYNSQAAKLKLNDGLKDIGHLNIYNTKKLNLVPKYHELKNKSYQQELETLWTEFLG